MDHHGPLFQWDQNDRGPAGELEAMKLTDLKEICRSNSLPVSGTKARAMLVADFWTRLAWNFDARAADVAAQ